MFLVSDTDTSNISADHSKRRNQSTSDASGTKPFVKARFTIYDDDDASIIIEEPNEVSEPTGIATGKLISHSNNKTENQTVCISS